MNCCNLYLYSVIAFCTILSVHGLSSLPLNEGFDDITTLTTNGWSFVKNSISSGTTTYFQGDATVFAAPDGATNSYVAMNYNSVTGADTISSYLMSPEIALDNSGGTSFQFKTRTVTNPAYPDRLLVKYSTSGSSVDPASFNFQGSLLLSINDQLTTSGYPNTWTTYTVTVPAQPATVTGRIAFHYNVPDGGPSGANSDYIGIDSVVITGLIASPSPTASPSPSTVPSSDPTPSSSVTPTASAAVSQPSASATPTVSASASSLPSATPSSSPASVEPSASSSPDAASASVSTTLKATPMVIGVLLFFLL